MDEWHFIAERKIREAMEEGAFDHLEGMGKPLNLDENPFEDSSSRMAHRLLKNNGLAPAWVQEAREIEAESSACAVPRSGAPANSKVESTRSIGASAPSI